MKVAIIGFGIEGLSALHYWLDKGAEVTICDQDPKVEVPKDAKRRLGPGYLDHLGKFDVIMRTASVKPADILTKNPGVEDKITTVVEEFMRVSPSKNVIGVTGTKGKGTTSSLIAAMLEAAGKQVFLGGNIGTSPLDFLPQVTPESWIVLELSSFQLYDLKISPRIAVCLMVAPEHLDWHADEMDYTRAKAQLFAHQGKNDTAIYYADGIISHKIASQSPGRKIAYYDEPGAYVADNHIKIDEYDLCRTDELKLLGKHNWQNVCAAVTAVWQVAQVPDAIRNVLLTFSGLPHRLEFVREVDDITYYDDSFGTTPETAIVAIKAFKEPKVVILGGYDKGVRFDDLARTVAENDVRHVVLIGTTAPKIRAALQEAGYTHFSPGGAKMSDIVTAAREAAKPGDVVLLSTACASFDLFDNYKDRGNQFKEVVQAL